MTIALTHSEGRLEGLEGLLEQRGHRVLRIPLVRTTTLAGVSLAPLEGCPWWLFSSGAAVRAVLELGARLEAHKLGAVGKSTALELQRAGGRVELVGESGAEELARSFLAMKESGPVGLPRGSKALPTLEDLLREGGLEVRPVAVYQSETLPWPSQAPMPEVILLASPSAVTALPQALAHTRFLALGETTARPLRERGWSYRVVESPQVQAVLSAIIQLEGELCSI